MKVLALQHSAGDTPAAAGEILGNLGHELEVARTVELGGDPVPMAVEADALMLFGGGASLTGLQRPDWIGQEQELVRMYADAGRRVMGICLGSQIVASALGAKVTRNLQREVGWHHVSRVDCQSHVGEAFPDQFMAFHWHQDTFGIPPGGQCLLRSDGCDHQGFVVDDRIFGFQCHLEATQRTVDVFLMVSNLHEQPGRFVHRAPQILQDSKRYLAAQTEILSNFLQKWLT